MVKLAVRPAYMSVKALALPTSSSRTLFKGSRLLEAGICDLLPLESSKGTPVWRRFRVMLHA